MLGAIAGDIIGSVYEGKKSWHRARTPDFQPLFADAARFTDDTVLTVAVADSILHGGDLVNLFKEYARAYPAAGYGGTFAQWAQSDDCEPYNSWGNGSAMRVSPVGFAYDLLDEVLVRARWSAEVTHNHPEGKEEIREFIERKFAYDLSTSIDELRPSYRFDVSCRGSVPPAIRAFLESTDYESAVRLAVSLGGDCDTIACIAGGIAEAYYGGVPDDIRRQAIARLDGPLREVVEEFQARYHPRGPGS
jgi:ADP-ribosylglycohydrolase